MVVGEKVVFLYDVFVFIESWMDWVVGVIEGIILESGWLNSIISLYVYYV